MWFADSDLYKWIEAASYVLASEDDPDLARRVEDCVGLVADAQDDDGYLNTYFALEVPDKRWTNLNTMHELYCAGHLIEAAVAHHRATGSREFLAVAIRLADHVDSTFGDEVEGPPGHEGIELALVSLARVTGEQRYVDLSEYFVEQRGRGRFEEEFETIEEIAGYEAGIATDARDVFYEDGAYDGSYAQAHAPFLDQVAVEGHAVRATYFLTEVADVVAETGNEEYLAHLEALWENMAHKRTYVTGGIGSSREGERFTDDYDLPNDTAYAETCAAIGSVFWNHRLFELTGEAKYQDLIERTLYNAVLAGISLDGTEFFYDNRLESAGDHHREGWFECACCPPNLARLFGSLEDYLYATADRTVYVNQFVGSELETDIGGRDVTVTQRTNYPWEDEVTLAVETAEPTAFTLAVRVPGWCREVEVAVDGEPVGVEGTGYAEIDREWSGETVEIVFDQPVRRLEAHPAVEADAGRVALARGPLVYCLEGADHDRPLSQYVLDGETTFDPDYRPDLLGGVVAVEADASVPEMGGWEGELYREAPTERVRKPITAVPYYAWDEREPGEMAVWLRTTSPRTGE
ncbi:glycoside hydrolase family 127 protein [Saliphagus infecundisoli]|uniref:Glycoside hydrolase family 127 protein n=1 Tax=Saliphagus infecundisoli TaxID=1849069 RepID=A0ABD5QCV2_9EURY|nr:beta-L-arabinofuranosidase domain-containing protein [Saliphagus infecundisoli]